MQNKRSINLNHHNSGDYYRNIYYYLVDLYNDEDKSPEDKVKFFQYKPVPFSDLVKTFQKVEHFEKANLLKVLHLIFDSYNQSLENLMEKIADFYGFSYDSPVIASFQKLLDLDKVEEESIPSANYHLPTSPYSITRFSKVRNLFRKISYYLKNSDKSLKDLESQLSGTNKEDKVEDKKRPQDEKVSPEISPSTLHNLLKESEDKFTEFIKSLFAENRLKKFYKILNLEGEGSAEVYSKAREIFLNDITAAKKKEFIQKITLSSEFLADLYRSVGDWEVRQIIVQNRNAPEEILKIAANPNPEELKEYTRGSDLPAEDFRVRMDAVANPNLKDSEYLRKAFKLEEENAVREAYIANPATPKNILNDIFEEFDLSPESENQKNENNHRFLSLAENDNTPHNVLKNVFKIALEKLFKELSVSKKKISNLKDLIVSDDLKSVPSDRMSLRILEAVLSNPSFKDEEIFKLFAESSRNSLRESIAKNSGAPTSVLKDLSKKDSDTAIRKYAEETLKDKNTDSEAENDEESSETARNS